MVDNIILKGGSKMDIQAQISRIRSLCKEVESPRISEAMDEIAKALDEIQRAVNDLQKSAPKRP